MFFKGQEMVPSRWSWPLLGLLAFAGSTPAQFIIGPPPPIKVTQNKSATVSRAFPDRKVTITFSQSSSRILIPVSPFPYYGTGFVVTSYYAPPPPTIFVIQQRRPDIFDEPLERPVPPRPVDPFEPAQRPLPGAPAGGFRPVNPKDRLDRPMPKVNDDDELMPPKGKGANSFRGGIPLPAQPLREPVAENQRLIKLGKEELVAEQYGRAAERFHQAVAVLPSDGMARFLLGQAYFALGKYAEATESLKKGLELQTSWPEEDFHVRSLYPDPATDFINQLRELDDVRIRHPNDPVLLFLKAYLLWFDGRRAEALPLFAQATTSAEYRWAAGLFLAK